MRLLSSLTLSFTSFLQIECLAVDVKLSQKKTPDAITTTLTSTQPMALATTITETKPKPFNEEIWTRFQRKSGKRNITWKCLDVIITKGPLKERTGGIYSAREIYPDISAEAADFLNDPDSLLPNNGDRVGTKRVKRGHDVLKELLHFIDIEVGIKFIVNSGETCVSIANVRPTKSVSLFGL